jgi:hypothetical protein
MCVVVNSCRNPIVLLGQFEKKAVVFTFTLFYIFYNGGENKHFYSLMMNISRLSYLPGML